MSLKLWRFYSRNDALRRNKGWNLEVDLLSKEVRISSLGKRIFFSKMSWPNDKTCFFSNPVKYIFEDKTFLLSEFPHLIQEQWLPS